jgi:predicted SAM-dependent methyltransferase
MSETRLAYPHLKQFVSGRVLDIGCGGSAVTPEAITFDMPSPYTSVGQDPIMIRGSVTDLSMFNDNVFDVVWTSHLLEDWTYKQLIPIVNGIRRIIKPNGLLITVCPDQKVYMEHCIRTGQDINLAHKEDSFSLATFKEKVLKPTGPWQIEHEIELIDTYSFHIVVSKQ